MTAEITVDGMPIPPVAAGDEPEEQPRNRPRRKAILLLALVGLLATLVTIAIWYLLFRQPIAELPLPLIPETQVPTYAAAIYGAQQPSGVAVSPSGDRIYAIESGSGEGGVIFDASGPAPTMRPCTGRLTRSPASST
jgi:hypothetical protein